MHPNPFSAGRLPWIGSRWGAYDAPPDPLVGWEGDTPSPLASPLDAFSVSNSAPPQRKILATPVAKGSGTENKSFAKVRNLDHTPVAKDTGYSV